MYNIIETDYFKKNKKYYKKKFTPAGYKELEDSLDALYDQFDTETFEGDNFYTEVENDGRAYKLRIGIKAMKLSQSNGIRTIYYAIKDDKEVYMLALYRKADMDPSTNELKTLVSDIMKTYI